MHKIGTFFAQCRQETSKLAESGFSVLTKLGTLSIDVFGTLRGFKHETFQYFETAKIDDLGRFRIGIFENCPD